MLYFLENINLPITSNVIEEVIKDTHIFNDIVLASHLHIIKVSSKSDITVICVDVWDLENNENFNILFI